MPRPVASPLANIESIASLAALGQRVLDLVKETGLAKPRKRAKRVTNGEAKPRRKRRTKAEMAAARAVDRALEDRPVRRPARDDREVEETRAD